jgi:hypothetical protein
MSFEIKTRIDEDEKEYEIIEESITTENTTVKLWTKVQIELEIAILNGKIQEIEERQTILQEQLTKFKKV